MRARQHEDRLADRAAQTRGWAAPLPPPDVLSRVRDGEGARVRMEWDTRDTMNNRLWDATTQTGAKMVTSAMLAAHPSGGANTQVPTASSRDTREWSSSSVLPSSYFPNTAGPGPGSGPIIPALPASSMYKNPWFTGMDVDKGDATREVRGIIREDSRFRGEDTSSRITGRMFDTHWIPSADTHRIVESQLNASDKLRFGSDDWRQQFRS